MRGCERFIHQIGVFRLVLILALVSSAQADAGASMRNITHCHYLGYCITLPDGPVTTEAGLCAVIPCSFVVPRFFKPQSLVWSKCDTSTQQCEDRIFHKNNRDIQPEFRGRVSLLESDIKQLNCSIVINDLKESDSGVYRLTVNGFKDNKYDGFNFPLKPSISVQGLQQKPTLEAPPMTAGQEATLTCTAPGLCSGSTPGFTWTWSGAGGDTSHIPGSVTAFRTENLTAIARRHSSTLTFNASAELHGTIISCEISLTGGITTEETVMLNVTAFPEILKSSACRLQSDILTCVCLSEGLPLPTVTWPLRGTHSESCVTTAVSKRTVSSSITVTVRSPNISEVTCISSNSVGEVRHTLTVPRSERVEEDDGSSAALSTVPFLALSLVLNVVLTISIVVLWKWSKKKVKQTEADRTYMSLRQTDRSPEYDVIGPSQK